MVEWILLLPKSPVSHDRFIMKIVALKILDKYLSLRQSETSLECLEITAPPVKRLDLERGIHYKIMAVDLPNNPKVTPYYKVPHQDL